MNLSVVSAKYVAPLKVELHFSDGTVKTIDVGAFIRKHPHPQYNSFFPLGVSTDLQSVVKKCPNLFVFWGFAIPSHQYCHSDGFAIPSHQYCLANLILSSKNTKNIRKTYSISPKNK